MNRYFPVLLLAALSLSFADTLKTVWEKSYGGTSDDIVISMQRTTDNGFIACGLTKSFGSKGNSAWILRFNSMGDTLWTKIMSGANSSDYKYANVIRQTKDLGFAMAGTRYNDLNKAGLYNFWLVRLKPDGDTLWTKVYDMDGNMDYCSSMEPTLDGGYIMAGYSETSKNHDDVMLAKTDSSGIVQWKKLYGGSSYDRARCVRQTADSGYVVTGYSNSFGSGGYNVYLLRLNKSGDTLWTKTYGGSSADSATCVRETADGGFLIAGITKSFGTHNEDVYIVRTESDGDTLWTKNYGYASWNGARSLQLLSDGGFAVVGYATNYTPNSEAWLLRMNSIGDTLWTRNIGIAGISDYGWDFSALSDTSFVVLGGRAGISNDIWITQVGGDTIRSAIEKTSLVVGPFSLSLKQNRPNPFSNSTRIDFITGHGNKPVSLKVFNLQGQLLRTLVDGQMDQGCHSVIFDGNGTNQQPLSQGVYFLQLQDGGRISTRSFQIIE